MGVLGIRETMDVAIRNAKGNTIQLFRFHGLPASILCSAGGDFSMEVRVSSFCVEVGGFFPHHRL